MFTSGAVAADLPADLSSFDEGRSNLIKNGRAKSKSVHKNA